MPNFRMLPPVAVGAQTINVNGRAYSAAPGSVVDVIDADAQVLASNGWTKIAFSGPTSDTTINALVVWDGATWRNPVTGAGV
jgi:hypothetical protein